MIEGLRGYCLLIQWEFLRLRSELVMAVVFHVLLAIGVLYGMAFLIPSVTSESALYLTTGAPSLTLLLLGLTMVAQDVARSKMTGRHEYMATLPLPALTTLAASVSFWLLANLPGTALALWVARLRFDIDLAVNPLVVPVILLAALTTSSVGYAIAQQASPGVTQQATQFISIGILLFSPINFPIDRLPPALQDVHHFLPITYMADLIRWSLTGRATHDPVLSFAVVGIWCAAGLALSYRVATRRR